MSAQPRILIVDDEVINRRIIQRMLEKKYQVFTAENGRQALEMMPQVEPDLILLDILMPDLDGFQVCEMIKEHKIWRFIPIIFLTALGAKENTDVASAAGADGFLEKPVDEATLLPLLDFNLKMKFRVDHIRELYYELENDQKIARTSQDRLLSRIPQIPWANISTIYQPYGDDRGLNFVCGDFYDFRVSENQLHVFLGDATGHGTLASFVTFMARIALQQGVMENKSPSGVICHMNEMLMKVLPDDCFMTACYMVFDFDNNQIIQCNAGHPGPICFSAAGSAITVTTSGLPLGIMPFAYDEEKLPLGQGDRMLLYTDGLVEVANAEDQLWGHEGLKNSLSTALNLPLSQWIHHALATSRSFNAQSFFNDDVTVIAIERA
ncbi:MAG: fused response regulator/phosphatase [SAR324 cluster bacterium]|nr:fused response regulator/phosphatase [SAR324 cluster bacterium]